MTAVSDFAAQASRNVEILRKLNKATLIVACFVYVGIIATAIFYRVGPLALFASCIMLAEVLVFQFVRTWCDFLERSQH